MRLWLKIFILLLVLAGAGSGVYFFISRPPSDEAQLSATPRPGLPAAPGADLSRRSDLDADDDGDGLSNRDELAWGTDPLKADTDGDGYLDGEEVRAGHDPRIPAPNDKLDGAGAAPAGPAANQQRLASLLAAPTIDPYLKDEVSYAIEGGNLTEAYERAVPAAERSEAGQIDYALAVPVEVALPRPENLPAPQRTTPAMLNQYLAVAQDYAVLADQGQYRSAQAGLYRDGNTNGFDIMRQRFAAYRERLVAVPVPEAAISLHTLLLAYSQAQTEALGQIVTVHAEDPVKARVAERQSASMDKQYFPVIQGEFTRLHQLAEEL